MPKCPCCGSETKQTEFSIEKKDFDKVKVIGMNKSRPVQLSHVRALLGEVASVLRYDDQKRRFIVKQGCNDRVMVCGTQGRWALVSKLIEKHNSLADKMSKLKEEKKPAKLVVARTNNFSRKSSPNEIVMMQQKEREPYEDMIKLLKSQKLYQQHKIEKQQLTTLALEDDIRKLQQELYRARAMANDQKLIIFKMQKAITELEKKNKNVQARQINFLMDDIRSDLNRPIGLRNNISLKRNVVRQQPIVSQNENHSYDKDSFSDIFGSQASIALKEADKSRNIDFGGFDKFN